MENYNHLPKWRTDAVAHGQPGSRKESQDFQRKCFELTLVFKPHDTAMLTDLVRILRILSQDYQLKIWKLIDEWSRSEQSDEERTSLREGIRLHAFSVRKQPNQVSDAAMSLAQKVYDQLSPQDVVMLELWLFKTYWVHESTLERDIKYDYKKRDERINTLRINSMTTMWNEAGVKGVYQLILISEAPEVVGWYLSLTLALENRQELITQSINIPDDEISPRKMDCFLRGFFSKLTFEAREDLLEKLWNILRQNQIVRLLNCFPFNNQTWALLRRFSYDISETPRLTSTMKATTIITIRNG